MGVQRFLPWWLIPQLPHWTKNSKPESLCPRPKSHLSPGLRRGLTSTLTTEQMPSPPSGYQDITTLHPRAHRSPGVEQPQRWRTHDPKSKSLVLNTTIPWTSSICSHSFPATEGDEPRRPAADLHRAHPRNSSLDLRAHGASPAPTAALCSSVTASNGMPGPRRGHSTLPSPPDGAPLAPLHS